MQIIVENEKKLILEACGNKETAIHVDNNNVVASTQITGDSDTDNNYKVLIVSILYAYTHSHTQLLLARIFYFHYTKTSCVVDLLI